ncbi:MAG: DUF5916 domain-containing protein, partial [Acidobacteriota bacterium]
MSWVLVTLLAFSASARATPTHEQDRPHFQIQKSSGLAVVLDGRLDEAAWDGALVVPLTQEFQPGDGVEPPVRTDALVLFDDENLYVAFRAHDPEPSAIRAHLMDRDEMRTMEQEDSVSFTIDPFDDQRRAYRFELNPLGVQADALISGVDGTADESWDAVWQSAGHIDEQGWSVEARVPFHQLRFPKTETVQSWGFDFRRSYPRSVRHQIAAHYVDPADNCSLCQVPRITGFTGLRTGLGLEIVPTVVVDRTDSADAFGGDLIDGDEETEGGLFVRWSPKPNLTFNGTINPDFSQVEADAVQLAVNERFALFFPERRPFFLESSDLFVTPLELVFTRTIVDPEWGLKLTGKSGSSAYGVFTADDEINNITIPTADTTLLTTLPGNASTVVGRWRRDVGESSAAGLLVTDRQGDGGYSNRVISGDGLVRFGSKHSIQFQAATSETRYPEVLARLLGRTTDAFDGHALQAFYTYDTRDWAGSLGYREIDSDFRADTGFITRAGFETWRGQVTRTFWDDTDDDWLVRSSLGLTAIDTQDEDGDLLDRVIEVTGRLTGAHQTEIGIELERRDESINGLLFEDMDTVAVSFDIQPTGWIRLGLELTDGELIEIREIRRGEQAGIRPEFELKLG